jgi:hypothetical protein
VGCGHCGEKRFGVVGPVSSRWCPGRLLLRAGPRDLGKSVHLGSVRSRRMGFPGLRLIIIRASFVPG